MMIEQPSPFMGPDQKPSAFTAVVSSVDCPNSQAVSGSLLVVDRGVSLDGYIFWFSSMLEILESIKETIFLRCDSSLQIDEEKNREAAGLLYEFGSQLQGTSWKELISKEKVFIIIIIIYFFFRFHFYSFLS